MAGSLLTLPTQQTAICMRQKNRNGQDIVRTVQTMVPTYACGTVYTQYVDLFSDERVSEFKAEAFF